MTLPLGLAMKPTLKKRSFQSGWRALACAMMKQSHSRASLPSSSVSSPGISIAHSRANLAWSRSSTSSLKACSAPSGIASKRTGMLNPESQLAALVRCFKCSRLILMSLRERIPRMVGTRPTAVYGLIMNFPADLREADIAEPDLPASRLFCRAVPEAAKNSSAATIALPAPELQIAATRTRDCHPTESTGQCRLCNAWEPPLRNPATHRYYRFAGRWHG